MWRKIAFLISVSVLVSFSSTLFATDRLVPSQYATIQAAIDASVNGDTVIIADGTYIGSGNYNIDFGGKAITVRSENGPENCIIDCQGGAWRRGFYFHSSETATSIISGLTIKNGNADYYGGGIYCEDASPNIENCIITNNKVGGGMPSYGGGICCDGVTNTNPTIIGCTIMNNIAQGYDEYGGWDGGDGWGGGIYTGTNCNPIIEDCDIINNSAKGGWGYPGGNAGGGGIFCSSATIRNCLIVSNTAIGQEGGNGSGGGISSNLAAIITNCTIMNNNSGIKGVATTVITNCIVWGNGDDIYGCSATYSCIEDGDTGTGNISTAPCFVTGRLGTYYLRQTGPGQPTNSPCVDTGSDTAVNLGLDDCTTRTDQFRDKGTVDMGYHYPVAIGTSDIYRDWNVNLIDYAILAADWLICDNINPLAGDIDEDECVDANDLGLLAESWLDYYELKPNVGWWKLDETSGTTAYDSNGTNHGTLYGNPVWTTGQIEGALAFDGVDDYVDCGNSTSLDITSSISISAWVKFNNLSSYRTILAKRGATSDSVSNYSLRTNANKLEFYYKTDTTWHIYATSNTNMVAGVWYHIAVTFTFGTGSSMKCYLNGIPLTGSWTSGNGNAAATVNTKPLTIGALTNGERLNGTLDDVRIYNRALSDGEVQQLYENGLP